MGIFSKIKDAIFGKKAEAATPAQPGFETQLNEMAPVPGLQTGAPAAMSEVDVEAVLTQMQSSSGRDLNWRNSIVDLMKLVGMESSLAERKELAQELGYTGALDGSAEMNIWLHKRVMKELAANGGKVPASMLD